MNSKRLWVGLLCFCFVFLFFENANAQDRSKRAQRKRPGWKGPPIGKVVKDFELPILDGGKFKLSDQRGKIVVIELGACT